MQYLQLSLMNKFFSLSIVLFVTVAASAQNHPVYCGDVNCDGTVDVADIELIQKHILKGQEPGKVSYDILDISSLPATDSIRIIHNDKSITTIAVADIASIEHVASDIYTLEHVSTYTQGSRRSYYCMIVDGDKVYAAGGFGYRAIDYADEFQPKIITETAAYNIGKDLIGRGITQNDSYIYMSMRQNSAGEIYKHNPQISFDFEQPDEGIDGYRQQPGIQIIQSSNITIDLLGARCPNKGQQSARLRTAALSAPESTSFIQHLTETKTEGDVSFWLKIDDKCAIDAEMPLFWNEDQTVISLRLSGEGGLFTLQLNVGDEEHAAIVTTFAAGEWYNLKLQLRDRHARLFWRGKEAGDWQLLDQTDLSDGIYHYDAFGFGLTTGDSGLCILVDDYYYNETELDEVSYLNGALVVIDKATNEVCCTYHLDVKATEIRAHGNTLVMNCLYGYNIYSLDDPRHPELVYTFRNPTYKEYQGIGLYDVGDRSYAFLCNYNKGFTILDITSPYDIKVECVDESYITYEGVSMKYISYNFDVVVDYPYVYLTHLINLAKHGTDVDYRGIQVLDISDYNNVQRTLYPVPQEDLCIKPYGDKCPVRIGRFRNSLFIDNGDMGLLRFDMQGEGKLRYAGPFEIDGCQSAFLAVSADSERLFIAEDCYQNLPASLYLFRAALETEGGSSSGIEEVHTDYPKDTDAPLYDLYGRKHKAMQPGFNILEERKLLVK